MELDDKGNVKRFIRTTNKWYLGPVAWVKTAVCDKFTISAFSEGIGETQPFLVEEHWEEATEDNAEIVFLFSVKTI